MPGRARRGKTRAHRLTATHRDQTLPPGDSRGIVLFQFVFGLLWFATASVLTGEPELMLRRADDDRVDLEYRLHLYGLVAARETHLRDVSPDCGLSTTLGDVSRRGDGSRGPGTTSAMTVQTHHWITFWSRDGQESARLPGVFDTSAIGAFFDSDQPTYHERCEASAARRYGMGFIGAVGGLVLLGGLRNTVRLVRWTMGAGAAPPDVTGCRSAGRACHAGRHGTS